MTRVVGSLPGHHWLNPAPQSDRQFPGTLWLDDPLARDPQRGGPAAHLARLAERYPVPPGFVVTSSTFSSGSVRPSELAFAYRRLATIAGNPEPTVIVRALPSLAASASIPHTLVNIRGVGAIVAAIEACLAASISHDGRSAVIVQLMEPADVSVTACTSEAYATNGEHVLVAARWGLAVGDSRCSDRWLVRVHDGLIVDACIAEKQRMTVSSPGGVSEAAVPHAMRTTPTLTHEQTRQVATLCSLLRAEHGAPVCVNAAFAGGWLSLLQCRPLASNGLSENEPAA
ncbi:MAG: hypothetical protein M9890_13620 [Thermomicrobiales bacterium]|nr:hypothetical protein [Thermomicrobiales bacterium]